MLICIGDGIRDSLMQYQCFCHAMVVLTSLRIGMVQRNSVWQHQRRRKVMECQGNYLFRPCPEMGVGETCI